MTSRLHPTGAFLHLPRTGGTWVFKVLSYAGIIAGQEGHEHGHGHHERWAFTVLRNPAAWWCSVWRYQCDQKWPSYPDAIHPLHDIGTIPQCDLQTWVDIAAKDFPDCCGKIFSDFTNNAKFVLRTEQLRQDMAALGQIVKWVGVDYDYPAINDSKVTTSTGMVDLSGIKKSEKHAYDLWNKAGL